MAVLQSEPVVIPQTVYDVILSHAREGKPEEICGIIRGRGLTGFEAVRGRNLAEDRIDNYDVDPQTLLLQFAFEDEGDEMMGIYHSHPISVAYPSATDAWNAHYPECIYFIVSLEFDESPVLRAFRMTPHFVDLDIDALRAALEFYETRAGLFAYYQPAEHPVAPAIDGQISGLQGEIAPPFYVVYYQPDADEEPEGRVVTLAEHPVQVVEAVA